MLLVNYNYHCDNILGLNTPADLERWHTPVMEHISSRRFLKSASESRLQCKGHDNQSRPQSSQ